MSAVEALHTTALQVGDLRDGLGRVRSVLEQADSVLTVADDVLGKADDVLEQAAEAVETSRRWAPRVAVVVGVLAVAGVVGFVVWRRTRRRDDSPEVD
jgi:hypothetical protein